MKQLHWSKLCLQGEAYHLTRAHLHGSAAAVAHGHDFAELFWIEKGHALHHLNGHTLPLESGDLIFIRTTDCHALTSDSQKGFVIVNLAFPAETLDFLRARYFKREKRWFWKAGPLPDMVRLDRERLAWLAQWVNRLDSSARTRMEVEIFLLELFRELHEARPPREAGSGPEWLEEALRHMADPEVLAGGTAALARRAGRTPQHLNATLQKVRGITATDAVNQARMEVAARELCTSTKKIIEICFDCGLQNLAHFYHLFRQQYGTTPRVYRLRHHAVVR